MLLRNISKRLITLANVAGKRTCDTRSGVTKLENVVHLLCYVFLLFEWSIVGFEVYSYALLMCNIQPNEQLKSTIRLTVFGSGIASTPDVKSYFQESVCFELCVFNTIIIHLTTVAKWDIILRLCKDRGKTAKQSTSPLWLCNNVPFAQKQCAWYGHVFLCYQLCHKMAKLDHGTSSSANTD